MNYRPVEASSDFESMFGHLNIEQLWILVKFAKHIRMRARNNTAFNNYVSAVFPYARFDTVDKIRKDGSKYPGLKIIIGDSVMEESENE